MATDPIDFSQFTEDGYRQLLALAAKGWEFIPFSEAHRDGRLCLWRHDIDMSPHRALKLARIEKETGVRTTYFVHFHSYFYNALEPEVTGIILQIRDLGHDIGLHFDLGYYAGLGRAAQVPQALEMERDLLSNLCGREVKAFSYHNPDMGQSLRVDDDVVAGMFNAYGKSIRERYSYVSDSNGYWRFRPLRDVLESGAEQRLHVLTHAEWWTPEAFSPRDRVSRGIEGRARSSHARYDAIQASLGRRNIR